MTTHENSHEDSAKLKELEHKVDEALKQIKELSDKLRKALDDSFIASHEKAAADFLNRKSKWVIDAKEAQKKWSDND